MMRVSSAVEQRSHTPSMQEFESLTRYHITGCDKVYSVGNRNLLTSDLPFGQHSSHRSLLLAVAHISLARLAGQATGSNPAARGSIPQRDAKPLSWLHVDK